MTLEEHYRGRAVLITGHTGFKGAWLSLWLARLGARVTGVALDPERPSLFENAAVAEVCEHMIADVRDVDRLCEIFTVARPDFVFHLAAQALVGRARIDPLGTYATNVIGTANVLDAVRRRGMPCAVVIVTSDKCYRPPPGAAGYAEADPLGGDEPYASSKAGAEHVVSGYRGTYFPQERLLEHGVAVATVRAGNVIGGGDWAEDRVVPDAIRALTAGVPIAIRNPGHIRPWQHVLAPLEGYLELGARLDIESDLPTRARHATAWNFGPPRSAERTVEEIVELVIAEWGSGTWSHVPRSDGLREAPVLRLDSSKAQRELAWGSRWALEEACRRTVQWYRSLAQGAGPSELRSLSEAQIAEYAP